jgi:hypothetical protein
MMRNFRGRFFALEGMIRSRQIGSLPDLDAEWIMFFGKIRSLGFELILSVKETGRVAWSRWERPAPVEGQESIHLEKRIHEGAFARGPELSSCAFVEALVPKSSSQHSAFAFSMGYSHSILRWAKRPANILETS